MSADEKQVEPRKCCGRCKSRPAAVPTQDAGEVCVECMRAGDTKPNGSIGERRIHERLKED